MRTIHSSRRCDSCGCGLSSTESRRCTACKTLPERRVYVSNDLGRPWHILAEHTPYSPGTPEVFTAACGARLNAFSYAPGWPRKITGLSELGRQYGDALVCRQCSDQAPLS